MDNELRAEGFIKAPAPAPNGEAVERVVPRPGPLPQPQSSAPEAPAAAPGPEELPAPVNLESPKETWPVKIRLLHKPTRDANNQPTSELKFREPTGGDIIRYGNPVWLDNSYEVKIDERKMSMMMSVLAGIHFPFIEALDPRDWSSCAYRLRPFFVPSMEGWE
jgi:hypothetical protein